VGTQTGEFLLVDKPYGWTSFDVVAKIRNGYKKADLKRKIGHCGTLDPLATGLLMLATGKKTKEISSIEVLEKDYTGQIKLGVTTPSYDAETEETESVEVNHLTADQIVAVARSFIGKQKQLPPMFSATWHKGKRLYELARKGVEARDRKTKDIEIFDFEITDIQLPFVEFYVRVSKGTYIRTIAHEFGQKLGVGGYLTGLRRTKIGQYSVDDAKSIEEHLQVLQHLTSIKS
jgi:tRNA pseudouridine55 synthase